MEVGGAGCERVGQGVRGWGWSYLSAILCLCGSEDFVVQSVQRIRDVLLVKVMPVQSV